MTIISQGGINILICVGIVLFFIMICLIRSFIKDYFIYQRRRNRIIPIATLIRIRQERLNREATERYIIETEKYNKVMEELKNYITVINADNSISIGISHSSNLD